jgi:hypothetical protein
VVFLSTATRFYISPPNIKKYTPYSPTNIALYFINKRPILQLYSSAVKQALIYNMRIVSPPTKILTRVYNLELYYIDFN